MILEKDPKDTTLLSTALGVPVLLLLLLLLLLLRKPIRPAGADAAAPCRSCGCCPGSCALLLLQGNRPCSNMLRSTARMGGGGGGESGNVSS
jgi:hypothetical protein